MVRDSRGGHNRKKINEDFFKIWTPKMAYVLGFMYADGALLNTNASSRTYYLMFSNNDLPLLKDIRAAMSSQHAIYVKPPHVMDYRNRKYLSKTGYVLRIGNKVMYQDLIDLGIQHQKSKIMHFPDVTEEYFPFFVRGYFDGDGCINWYFAKGRNYPSLRVLFSSASVDFLDSLAEKTSKYLNIPLPHLQAGQGAFNLIFQGVNAMSILSYMYFSLVEAPYLHYKYEKYLDYRSNLIGPRVKAQLLLRDQDRRVFPLAVA